MLPFQNLLSTILPRNLLAEASREAGSTTPSFRKTLPAALGPHARTWGLLQTQDPQREGERLPSKSKFCFFSIITVLEKEGKLGTTCTPGQEPCVVGVGVKREKGLGRRWDSAAEVCALRVLEVRLTAHQIKEQGRN